MSRCPNCRAEVDDAEATCPHCGFNVPPAGIAAAVARPDPQREAFADHMVQLAGAELGEEQDVVARVRTSPLARLEEEARPYRARGFQVYDQSENALTLVKPKEPFRALLFIICLILFWPLAVAVAVEDVWMKRDRRIVVRLTGRGGIEVTGDTEEPYRSSSLLIALLLLVGLAFVILVVVATRR